MPVALRPVALLAATLALGCLTGIADVRLAAAVPWPVGLLAGCVLWQRSRGGAALTLAVAVPGAALGLVLAGWGWDEATGVALAHVSGVAVAVLVLTATGRRRAALLTEADISRFVSACLVGALAAGVVVLAWCFAVTGRVATGEGAAVVATHGASLLALVPLFLRRHHHAAIAGRVEQLVVWVVIVVVTFLVFVSSQPAALAFVVVAALAWGARRLGAWSGQLELLVVASITTPLTLEGLGPFDPPPAQLDWTPDGAILLLQLFVFCCALVVVPTVLTVGLERASLREASEQRARMERIVSSADRVAIIGSDAGGRITLFNPGAERLLGYRASEVLGGHAQMFHTPAEISRLTADLGVSDEMGALAVALASPEVAGREVRYRRKDGVERTFLANISQVRDLEGEVTGYVCIAEDISDRVSEQAALEEAVTRLQELDASKDTFVSSVSHELRTPLTSIVGYLELLRDREYGDLAPPQQLALDRISDNSDRLLALIEDLLTFSRLGQDDLQVERREVDLAEAVRAGCRVVEPLWRARRTTVEVAVPSHPVPVTGDRAMLERLVVNLVGNAVKFTHERGRVEVSLRVADGTAELAVADDGIGIPLDEQPRLFTRFFRSRTAMRDAVQGTGIGLSIVKAVVDAHGGAIDVESAERVGTTVCVRVPLRETVPAG